MNIINVENIIKILKEKKYRITNIRKLIIECFNHNHKHTIEDLVDHISKKVKHNVNISSVYNTLEMLVNENIIDMRVDIYYKKIYYEVISEKNFHIHIYENGVESIKEIDNDFFEQIKKYIKTNKKIKNLKIDVLIE